MVQPHAQCRAEGDGQRNSPDADVTQAWIAVGITCLAPSPHHLTRLWLRSHFFTIQRQQGYGPVSPLSSTARRRHRSYPLFSPPSTMTTTTLKDLYNVPLLNSTNFPTWKFKMELVLKDRGLWSCVQPLSSPSLSAGTDSASTPSAPLPSELVPEHEQKALAQICLTVSEEMIPLVRSCKTAREAWTTICEQFEQKGMANRVSLKRQLFNTKFVDGVGSMQAHINSLRALALQLEIVGAPVSDEDLAVVLLCSLPSRFDPFVVLMEGRAPQDITFNSISSRLLGEAERQATQNQLGTLDYSTALTAAVRTRSRGGGEEESLRPRCPWCGRRGHTESKCWDKEDGKPRALTTAVRFSL